MNELNFKSGSNMHVPSQRNYFEGVSYDCFEMSCDESEDGVLGPCFSPVDFPFSFCADVLCIPYDAYRHYDYRHSETFKLDREATAYIQVAVPKIVNNWSSQELVDRATPELLAGESRDKIDRFFVKLQRL